MYFVFFRIVWALNSTSEYLITKQNSCLSSRLSAGTGQKSLMMLSLDLPTPTHFTVKTENEKFMISSSKSKSSLTRPSPLVQYESCVSLLTWNLQEVLNKAYVTLGLGGQLLKAPHSRSTAAPARQGLILHRDPRQDIHVRQDRSKLNNTTEGEWTQEGLHNN